MAEQLDNVVVVLPGIMGSVLRDAHGDDVWELSAGSILKGVFGRLRGLKALQLPEGIGDDHPGDGVTAPALMPDMHVVPGIWTVTIGYDRLHKWFADTFDIVEFDANTPERAANYLRFPYDWRLSNRYNAQQLGNTGSAEQQTTLVESSTVLVAARQPKQVTGLLDGEGVD